MGTIYILENKENGKCYVGQTIRLFNKRFREHNQSNSLIGKALRKYGVGSFNKTTLENIPDKQLDSLEQKYIRKYNSIAPNGYNSHDGGHGNRYYSKETRKKLSESHKGQIPWIKGKTHSKETRKKLSESHKGLPSGMKGKKHTIEAKQKMSVAQKGNKKWLGKTHTEESKEKNRIAHLGKASFFKGKNHTKEAKQKMSVAKKGKISSFKGETHTEESKEKNRIAHLGKSPGNKGIRTPHPCPVCGEQRKEKYVKEKFAGYLKTCGNKNCITTLRSKDISMDRNLVKIKV